MELSKELLLNKLEKCMQIIKNIREYLNIYKKYGNEIFRILRNKKYNLDDQDMDAILSKINLKENELNITEGRIADFYSEINEKDDLEIYNNQFKSLVINEIINYNFNNWTYVKNDRYITKLHSFEDRIIKRKEEIFSDDDNVVCGALYSMTLSLYNYISNLAAKINAIEIFKRISHIDNNIIMIGANGSGKTTFSRQLKKIINSNCTIIPAQHLLLYSNIRNLNLELNLVNRVIDYQNMDKIGNDQQIIDLLSHDFENLVYALLQEHNEIAFRTRKGEVCGKSKLERTIELWNDLSNSRTILNQNPFFINVETYDHQEYDFNLLSDGEKAIFYYIGHVLLSKKDSYVIVDEPENHINPAVYNKLWNILEKERDDCKFIYLTHNIDFAISRNDVTIIWNERFTPPSDWQFQIIKNIYDIPERYTIELLGSRRDILFCEGDDKSSYDYKLYTILFPEHTVIPVGGHLNVVNYCKAYNRNNGIFKNHAIGIIDGDCHEAEQKKSWEKAGIYTLDVNEIENILCDSLILDACRDRLIIEQKIIDKYKNIALVKFNANKNGQATWYVKERINNKIKNNFLSEEKDIKELEKQLKSLCNIADYEEIYNTRLKTIEKIINNNDYDEMIAISNLKNQLINVAEKELKIDNYGNKAIKIIQENTNLQNQLRDKYFKHIK